MNYKHKDIEDQRLQQMLDVIFKFAAGDLTARGTLAGDDSALDGVMAGINILGEELEARMAEAEQAQQAMSESEILLRGTFDAIRDGIIVVESQTRRHRMVNNAICHMLGYSREELLTMSVEDDHPEEDLPRVAREFEQMLRDGSGFAASMPMKRKDGTIFYVDISAAPTTINGEACVVGVFRDITDRRQAEEKILKLNQALEEKVQQLTRTQTELVQHRAHLELEVAQRTASLTEAQRIAHLGNWQWDVVNKTMDWSDEIYRIFGLEPKQVDASYEALLNAVHPQDRQLVDDCIRNALERQDRYSIEHRILQPDGTLRYVQGQAEVIQGEKGQPGSMVGTLQDITERKLAEEEIRKQQAITSQIIETIPMRVFWKDRTLHYLGCNTAFASDAGKSSPDELLGRDDFEMAWKDQAELYRADDAEVMDTDTPKLFYDEPQTTPTGEIIWLRTSKVPIHNKANEVVGMLGVYEDITERKQAEEEILRLASFPRLNPSAVIELDADGKVTFLNQAAERLFPDLNMKGLSHPLLQDSADVIAALRQGKRQGDVIHEGKVGEAIYELHLYYVHEVDLVRVYVLDISERKQVEQKIYLLATTDSLTGIANRRELFSQLKKEVERANRYGTPVSLAMYDLDFFKRVNDTFGHDEGDNVLRAVTELVKRNIRATDVVARWGGEEFMLLMPHTEIDAARNVVEKLRLAIAGHDFDKVGKLTVSFGVTAFKPQDDMDSVLKRVDDALYRAKEHGRNCVETL